MIALHMATEEPPRPPSSSRRPGAPGPAQRIPWMWIVLGMVAIYWLGRLGISAPETIPYSEFKQHLARGEVKELFVKTDELVGTLTRPAPTAGPAAVTPAVPAVEASKEPPGPAAPAEAADTAADAADTAADAADTAADAAAEAAGEKALTPFRTVRVEDPDLVEELEAAGIPYTGVVANPLGQFLLLWILPLGLMLLVFAWFSRSARRAGGQMMGFGKSKARLVPETGTGVRFDDVAGCDEAKHELHQMVAFLKNPGRFTALGGRIPKGVLLLGPPGTGKTLLARAVAGEAGVPFFSLTGSDFVEMFVGVGAARVRDLFAQANARAPCIIFVDEIDAIGRQRGVSMGVVNDEREQTLNQLLAEMDGFENNTGVILLGATNRPEILDRALLRPGRFDRQVVLDSPDLAGREAILRVHTRGKPMAADVDLARVAQATPGMSGADLANAVNEAALLAGERQAQHITQHDLEEAVERVVAGPERRSRRLEPEEKRRVAYHESGHALVAARCEHADPVRKITIVPRGRAALGYTMQLPEREHYLRTRDELLDRLAVILGGRAAEELVFGDVSTGPMDDLRVATDLARQMVCVYGMSERLGLAHCARPSDSFLDAGGALVRDCSEETSRLIDEEVRGLLDAARERARTLLEGNRAALERVAARLLETETLDRATFEALVGEEATAPGA